ncbi:protein-disulfide reductase DsbD family protein [Algihabitans sp.]|uniref:protein-disulfide reductase DsbD family protein n=1 Tax=Algihabitans sp. TaxID=2821514 RepID=UPI003BAC6704
MAVLTPLIRIFLALLLLSTSFSGVLAAAGAWDENEQARVRAIAATGAVGTAEQLSAGLEFDLADGWKTYWRSPGDAGLPVTADWSDSENVAEVEFGWPVPHRFSLFGLETFGYGGRVVFPLVVKPATPGEAISLRGRVDYLVCEEICIPHTAEVSLDLPAGAQTPSREGFLIERFRSQLPSEASGLSLESARLVGDALEVELASALPLTDPDVLVEAPVGWTFSAPEKQIGADGASALLRLTVIEGKRTEAPLIGSPVTLTLTDVNRGLERDLTLDPPIAPAASALPTLPERGLLAVLGLALLGGLILNLMPCVLPVLSIKLLSAVSHGGRDRGTVRLSFLASAAGILFSFLVLAGGAIALQLGGLAVGWGIQFQQPIFLAAMAAVVTLFACNLFGFFEVPLPSWLAGTAQLGDNDSLGGHFTTGAFATLLATPCSAPFLGTAVGFALSRGPGEVVAVFLALGLGFALPYLAVAAAPGLATALPKPGAWMVTLRRILGVALAATAVWLLSVLAVQLSLNAAVVLGGLLVLLGLTLLARHRGRLAPLPGRASAVGLIAACIAVAALARSPAPATAEITAWQPLDPQAIARHVAEGKTVFVDVTAEWCITCQVNKTLVLDTTEIAELLGGEGLVAMRGDWTRPDPKISDYLASFGRYGIPFNAVYGPDAPNGLTLPELLSRSAVLESLEVAGFDTATGTTTASQ